MAQSILSTVNKRKKLKAKTVPYFEFLHKYCHIGFRKSSNSKIGGTWVAKYKTLNHTIGPESDYEFDKAIEEAENWFKKVGKIKDHNYSLSDALNDYEIKLPIISKYGATPEKAKATVLRLRNKLSKALLEQPLTKLTKKQLSSWRDNLVNTETQETTRASKDTSNRILTILKAVLNVAYEDENISTRSAWETIKPFVNVGQSRELFLSDDEVKRLLDNTEGSFKEIIQGAILTGARYGELCVVLVEDYDKANGTIKFKGKTGSRNTTLSSGAITFFNKITQSKLPKANIFIKDGGNIWGKSHQSRPMKEAVINAKLPHDTVFYSLRHYHISKALLAGVNIHALAMNCGTSIRMIESNYGKFIKSDVKSMLDNIVLSA